MSVKLKGTFHLPPGRLGWCAARSTCTSAQSADQREVASTPAVLHLRSGRALLERCDDLLFLKPALPHLSSSG
ncbi:MAG: hypothetical protein AVDCRST_MAG68-4245 [uncultured Gemmatimonadetes bacterium]|uniref:Uncharacterized protein n=1 Tax=uncultured Gemmatimonadota bacterium TaxID=203437 RepID=A0A6J4MGF1_9BACT|nr:MAG: hypothetical protein AVDCRST_MAG68-4245 [uncultured Gemmatimonadota bacterium]